MVRVNEDAQQVPAALLAEVGDIPYFRVDAERNVVELSPAMERLTGFEAKDILGRSCLRLHRCEECLQGCGVFESYDVADQRLELYRADGSVVSVRKSGRVLLDGKGEIAGAIEVVQRVSTDLPARASADDGGKSLTAYEGDSHPGRAPTPEQRRRQAEEREAAEIRHALERAHYRRTDAALALGMSRTTLWRKMREYGL